MNKNWPYIKPYAILRYHDIAVEVMSYPANGAVFVRMIPGDPTRAKWVAARFLEEMVK